MAAAAPEHDPDKWEPVFGKDHAPNKKLEPDSDSAKNERALAPSCSRCDGLSHAQARHNLFGEKLHGASGFAKREIAKGEAAGNIVRAGFVDLRLQLIEHALWRATDHAAIRPLAIE